MAHTFIHPRTGLAAVGRVTLTLADALVRSVLAARLRQLVRTLQHRREAEMLAGLDERMLADIGINRADLRDAFSAPIWEDPTSVLATRAGERRRNGRRHAEASKPPRTSVPCVGFTPPPLDRPARLIL